MKQALKWLGWIFLLTVVLYVSALFCLCKIHYNRLPLFYLVMGDYAAPNGGHTYHASIDWSDTSHFDVVVLGASRAQRGYNTAIFDSLGIKMFNLGSPSQSLQNSRILLENHIKGGFVKEVWLDMVPTLFKGNAFESTSDLIQNWAPSKTAFAIACESKDARAINLWMKRLFCSNSTEQEGKGAYRRNGFVEVNASLSEKWVEEYQNGNFGKESKGYVTFSQDATDELQKIISYCQREKIKLKFIASPITVFSNRWDQMKMNEIMEPIVEQFQIPFIDYSHRTEWNTLTDFYDEKHLNAVGVRKFNLDLCRSMSSTQ